MLIIIYFMLFVIMLVVSTYTFFLVLSVATSFTVKVPFVAVKKNILPMIVAAMKIEQKSVIYDLGCGDGRVLLACYIKEPQASCIGFEKQLIPFWVARWRVRKTHIKILQGDFLKYNLSNATHVFVYLSSELMDELLLKFKQELSLGTRVVSCDYQFSNKQAIKIIDLKTVRGKLGKFLYVYEF
ncbi:MAG TPA: class I SAM-dependent methyltransferase [bacterium]|nr:class I SAM-dependent methyltransferase [bacterium]